MKKIKIYALALLMSMICFISNAENYVVTANKLNVRDEASKAGEIIGSFKKGDEVKVDEINGDWATVNVNGEVGYISMQYLSTPESKQKNTQTRETDTSEILIGFIFISIVVGIPIVIAIRKLKRKVRNFKADVKDSGLGEATMSRLEDWCDKTTKKKI